MLEYLSKNELAQDSKVYIFCDGPREDKDKEKVNEVKDVVLSFNYSFKDFKLIQRASNLGLAQNLSSGISEVLSENEKIIVLEDDLITSPLFLRYINLGLEKYASNSNIYSINGYMFPIPFDENSTFLSPLATSSWGWGTWKNRWKIFSLDIPQKKIIQDNPYLAKRFNIGDLNYCSYLDNEKSWAIKWYYHVFSRNGLGLFSTQSLVQNIGFDGSGENCGTGDTFQTVFGQHLPVMDDLDSINWSYEAKLQNFFKMKEVSQKSENIFKKVFSKIVRLINR